MRRINLLLTLSSLNVLLVTIERFSFTTKILLQPYNFLRLHEVFQISFIILFTVLIPLFLLKELSHNFESLKTKKGLIYLLLFVIGVYFYATGNGLHEVASFLFNQYCNVKEFHSTLCGTMFFNDYYTGNILYFIGAFCMNISLILFEKIKPQPLFNRKDMIILVANSLVYAVTIIAYDAFDRVLVGFIFSVITMIVVLSLLLTSKKKPKVLPFTLYCSLAYTIGIFISIIIRFH